MKISKLFKMVGLLSLLTLAILSTQACATGGAAAWGDPETGLILRYNMDEGQSLKYETAYQILQKLEIKGQEIDVNVEGDNNFTMTPADLTSGIYTLAVTLDSMNMFIETPQGRMAPDTASMAGKNFKMELSELGVEGEFTDTENLEYEIAPGKSRNAVTFFQAMFPDLPDTPVRVGDTWTSQDKIEESDEESYLLMVFDNTHRLAGFATVEGMECAKIETEITGSMEGKGKEGPMELVFKGEITGTDTWYFAYKNGVFVKSSSKSTSEGTIEGSGPQEITIPETKEFIFESTLVLEK